MLLSLKIRLHQGLLYANASKEIICESLLFASFSLTADDLLVLMLGRVVEVV